MDTIVFFIAGIPVLITLLAFHVIPRNESDNSVAFISLLEVVSSTVLELDELLELEDISKDDSDELIFEYYTLISNKMFNNPLINGCQTKKTNFLWSY